MADRKVSSMAGVRKYGKPIGTVISDGPDDIAPGSGDKGDPSLIRLQSLQRQFSAAQQAGDSARMRSIQKQFAAESRRVGKGRSLAEIMAALDGDHAKMVTEQDKNPEF